MTDSRDIQHYWDMLRLCAAGIQPSTISIDPEPGEIMALGDDLRTLARHVDRLVSAYGDYLAANCPGVDRSVFRDQLIGALDGNALYEIENAAEQLQDDMMEAAE